MASAATAVTKKLRILCLHGYKQYDTQFKNRTNALRKSLKSVADFHYVTAPHKIPFDVHLKQQKAMEKALKSQSNEVEQKESKPVDANIKQLDYLPNARAWWRSSSDGKTYEGIEETLKYVINIIATDGPFDGILGFSQGGVLTFILCLMSKYPKYFEKTFNLSADNIEKATFQFAWIIGGFAPRCDALKPLLEEMVNDGGDEKEDENQDEDEKLIDHLPLLLVVGKTDQFVSVERTLGIMQYFKEGSVSVVEHEGGHYVPSDKDVKPHYLRFLQSQL